MVVIKLCESVSSSLVLLQKKVNNWANDNSFLNPIAMALLNSSKSQAKHYNFEVLCANEEIYKVWRNGDSSISATLKFRTVNVREKTCSCGDWQDKKLPCHHPMRVAMNGRYSTTVVMQEWVGHMYRTASACEAYSSGLILPCFDSLEESSESVVLPSGCDPVVNKRGGQQKTPGRFKSAGEGYLKKNQKKE
jgi:hypothetical protein